MTRTFLMAAALFAAVLVGGCCKQHTDEAKPKTSAVDESATYSGAALSLRTKPLQVREP